MMGKGESVLIRGRFSVKVLGNIPEGLLVGAIVSVNRSEGWGCL